MMTMMKMMKMVMMMVMIFVPSSQSAGVAEDLQSKVVAALTDDSVQALLVTLVVLFGAALVGIFGALMRVVKHLPLFSPWAITGIDRETGEGSDFKLIDRIEEFHH